MVKAAFAVLTYILILSSSVTADEVLFTRKLGYYKVPLLEGISGLGVKVRVKGLSRCMFGDLDTLGLEMLASDASKTRVFLAVEKLREKRVTGLLGVQDITAPPGIEKVKGGDGYVTPIVLENSSKPLVAGLFICKDGGKKGRCNDKEIRPLEDVLNRYMANNPLPEGYVATDKVYYFKLIVIYNGAVYYPKDKLDKEQIAKLKEVLKKLGAYDGRVKEDLNAALSIDQTLGSLYTGDIDAGTDSVLVLLPYFDQGKCGAPPGQPLSPTG